MFWRKSRRAIESFHPLHQQMVHDRAFSAAMAPADWALLVRSFAGHDAKVSRAKWALPDRVPHVLVPLIKALSADVDPNRQLRIAVDLRGPSAPGKSGPSRQIAVRPPVISATETFSADTWLRVNADLRDGGMLDVTVTDRVRTRRMRKRSRSGKTKHKAKTKASQRIAVRRTLPKGVEAVRPQSPPPRGIGTRVARRKRTVVRADVKIATVPAPHTQLRTLLGVLAEPFRWTPQRPKRNSA